MNVVDLIKSIFSKPSQKGRDKAIIVKNLSNKYEDKTFLKNINFIVYKGEIFSIIGLSGSGKSSLLKCLMGLTSKSYGRIFFFGKHRFFKKKEIGFSPQFESFYKDLTVKENIELFAELNSVSKEEGVERGIEYLKKLRIIDYENNYPRDLSGGERKRLNIILSCLHKPELLILDEPFAGLDYYNRRVLWDFLTSLKHKGVTIVLSTHLLEEAQDYSSRVLILKDGKKFAYGTFKTVKKRIGFNYLYHVKFSYVSKKFYKSLKHFTKLKDVKIVYRYKKDIHFALDALNDKELINNFIERKDRKYEEVSVREPTLDEVMLASK